MNKENKKLIKSIIGTIISYLFMQIVIFIVYAYIYDFMSDFFLQFIISSTLIHLVLCVALIGFRDNFRNEVNNQKFDKVNLANKITMLRVSTLPTVLFILLASKTHPVKYSLIILVAIVFLTDFFDGYISRKYKEVTKIGRMLDSASDYSVLFVITLVFYDFSIIPRWFISLISARLFGQALMILIVTLVKKTITPKTSFLGKLTVASTMILYAFELLRFAINIPILVYSILEYTVGLIIIISIFDKILIMTKDLLQVKQEKRLEK